MLFLYDEYGMHAIDETKRGAGGSRFYLKNATTMRCIKRSAALEDRVNIYKLPAADCLADFHGTSGRRLGPSRRVALRAVGFKS